MPCACPTCGQTLPEDGSLRVDPAGVDWGGRFACLTRQEAGVLEQLRDARGAIVSKESLLSNLYVVEADEAEIKIIDVFICKLRKKLKPLGVEIGTVWGRGYRLVSRAEERTGA
jgi:DNA-binding response OmpR family regulator